MRDHKKAVAALGANPKQPTTAKGEFNFVVKAARSSPANCMPSRRSRRRARRIPHAFALARADIKELDAGLAAYRAGKLAAFAHDVNVWQSDHRTSQAFIDLAPSPAREGRLSRSSTLRPDEPIRTIERTPRYVPTERSSMSKAAQDPSSSGGSADMDSETQPAGMPRYPVEFSIDYPTGP